VPGAEAPKRPPVPPAPTAPRRSPAPPDARAALAGATAAAASSARRGGGELSAEERLARREERPRRRTLLILAGAVVILVLAVVLATRGGSSGGGAHSTSSPGTTTTQVTATGTKHKSATAKKKTSEKLTPPAETAVTVLNATETEGLARRVAVQLQQNGYSQAAAAFGKPPGSTEVTVVEFASGQQADAEGVAHSLSVSHVQPMEQAVATLAPSAKVVVLVGADKASTP
jgi:hypothetical protein